MKKRTIKALILLAVGVVINAVLAGVKMYIGLSVNSLAITLDATNNTFDIITDIITMIAFAVLFAPRSEKAPFGYGRAEYLAGFVVAVTSAMVGGLFFVRSLNRLAMPEPVFFGVQNCIFIIITIFIKLGLGLLMYFFNRKMKSKAIKAIMLDSFLDACMTSASAVAFGVSSRVNYAVDAIFGMAMSVIIVVFACIMIADNVKSVVRGDESDDEKNFLLKCCDECENIVKVGSVTVHDYGYAAKASTCEVIFEEGLTLADVERVSKEIADKVEKECGMKAVLVPVSEIKENAGEESKEPNAVNSDAKESDEPDTVNSDAKESEVQKDNIFEDGETNLDEK